MSRVLKNACSSLVPKSCFANCALYAITLCLVLFVVLPAWDGVATHFNSVAAELSTGSVAISLPPTLLWMRQAMSTLRTQETVRS